MSEPRRLLDESQDGLVLELIGSWREQSARSIARERTAAALGLATAVGSGAAWGAVGGARTASAFLSRVAMLKWFGGGALCGLALVGGAKISHRSPAPAASVELVAPPEPRPRHAATPPVLAWDEIPDVPPSARVSSVARPPASSKPAPESIAREIAALDRARRALAAGDARQTLGVLNELEASGHTGTFAPELLWLRLEALDQVGQGERARELAHRYLAEHPSGPMAARLRARWP